MLRGQMSPWQLEFVLNVHRNLPLKFHQNRVSNSWDIADIEFVWWGGGVESFYCQAQPCVEVRLGFWQSFTKSYRVIKSNTESCNGIQRYVESYSAVLYSIISYAKSHRVKWSNKKSYRVIQSYSESNFSHTESYKVMQNESWKFIKGYAELLRTIHSHTNSYKNKTESCRVQRHTKSYKFIKSHTDAESPES